MRLPNVSSVPISLLPSLAVAVLVTSACSLIGDDAAGEDPVILDVTEVDLEAGAFGPDPDRPVRLMAVQVGTCATDGAICEIVEGQNSAAGELDVDLTTLTAQPGETAVLHDHLNQVLTEWPDGVALSLGDTPIDTEISAALDQMAQDGIPIVAYRSDPDQLAGVDLLSRIGSDDYDGGLRAAQALLQAGNSGGGICLNSTSGDAVASARCSGFRDGLAQAGQRADILQVNANPAAAGVELADYLTVNPDTKFVLSVDPVGADAYYRFRSTTPSRLLHATFGMNDAVVSGFNNRITNASMIEQPYLDGYYPIAVLANFLRYGLEPFGELTATGPAVVTPSTFNRQPRPGNDVRLVSIQYDRCQQNATWCPVEEGQAAAAQALGIGHTVLAPSQADPTSLPQLVEQAIASAPDGIALTISDSVLLANTIDRINAAGIPVIGYHDGRGPTEDELAYQSYIGIDHYEAGAEAAQRLLDAGGTTRGVCINHAIGSRSLDLRCNGFNSTLSRAGIPVTVLEIGPSRSGAANVVDEYYRSFPDTDIFLTLGVPAATAFYDFLDSKVAAGRPAFHGTFDLTQDVVGRIDGGETIFAVDQQPFLHGYWSVTMLAHQARLGLAPGTSTVSTGPRFVTSADTAPLADLAGRYR